MAQVGFIGAGQMGLPMVERLLAGGHDVQVHARRPEVRAAVSAAGARVVDTSRDAAIGAELVIACLFSDAQLREACGGPDGALAGLHDGAVLATHVTGTRATVASLAQQATACCVVDAPVSGTADDIRAGQLTVLLGGDPAAVAVCTEVMSCYANNLLHVGQLGAALSVKLINNLLFAAHSQLAVSAVELGAEFGVSRQTLLNALKVCSAASYAVSTLDKLPDNGTFARLAGPVLRKDVMACAEELGVSGAEAILLMDTVRHGPLSLIA